MVPSVVTSVEAVHMAMIQGPTSCKRRHRKEKPLRIKNYLFKLMLLKVSNLTWGYQINDTSTSEHKHGITSKKLSKIF